MHTTQCRTLKHAAISTYWPRQQFRTTVGAGVDGPGEIDLRMIIGHFERTKDSRMIDLTHMKEEESKGDISCDWVGVFLSRYFYTPIMLII